jgi:Predicted membrane protein (DUF2142)
MADGRQFGGGRAGSARRLGLLAFVGFFLMIGAWSFAAPYNGTPDEQAHAIRAAGVALGQITPQSSHSGSGAYQQVPRGLVRSDCFQSKATTSAACAQPPSSDRTLVTVPTGAGWYNPLYYAAVGWPLRFWPGWPGLLIARLISAALSAALLAGALVSALHWSRLRLMAVGVVAVTTPMTLQMTSAVNPNGLEIAAGIALFASAVPLFLLGRGERPDRWLLCLAAVSGGILATLRAAGPLWLVFGAAALLLPLRWARIRRVLHDRVVRWPVAVLGLVVLLAVGWTISQKATGLENFREPIRFSGDGATYAVLQQWHQYTDELVGVMSYLDTRLPEFVYMIWEAAVGTIIVAALVQGTRLDRWRMFVIFLGGAVVPTFIQVTYLNSEGFVTQGRYMLPLLVGLVLVAAFILEERGLRPRAIRTAGRLIAIVVLPLQLVALAFTMARWQQGLPKKFANPAHDFNPLIGRWHPVVGSLTPLLVETAGICVVGALLWTTAGRPGIARAEGPHRPAGTVSDGTVSAAADTEAPAGTEEAVIREPSPVAADTGAEAAAGASPDAAPDRPTAPSVPVAG